MAVTPPTPANTLGPSHDTFPLYTPSTPVSPYGIQQPPWPVPKPVRTCLIFARLNLTELPLTETISRARAFPSS